MVGLLSATASIGIGFLVRDCVIGRLVVPVRVKRGVQVRFRAYAIGLILAVRGIQATIILCDLIRRFRVHDSIRRLEHLNQLTSLSLCTRVCGQFVRILSKLHDGGRGAIYAANSMRYHDNDVLRGKRSIGGLKVRDVRVDQECLCAISSGREEHDLARN